MTFFLEKSHESGGSMFVGADVITPPSNILQHVILYGQSISLGTVPSGATAITTTDSPTHLMFNTGVRVHYDDATVSNVNSPVRPQNMTSFVALKEQLRPTDSDFGETFASGMGLHISDKTLFSCTGRGAYPVAQLSRAPALMTDVNHFSNTYSTALYGSLLAEAAGLDYSINCIVWKQGEADAASGTTPATWKASVTTLLDDFRSHLAFASHTDTSNMPMLLDQLAFRQDTLGYGAIAVAALDLHRTGGNGIYCSSPSYDSEFTAINDVHFSSVGYRNYGERLGRIIDGGVANWNPTHITAASRVGTTITLTIHVPSPPLVRDTSTLGTFDTDGFEYSGAGIDSVTITDTGTGDNTATIEIELDADSSGDLRVAYENAGFNIRNTVGSNIRDSESAVTQYDSKPLYNWLCTDEWSL